MAHNELKELKEARQRQSEMVCHL